MSFQILKIEETYIVGKRWFVERSHCALKRQHRSIPDGDSGVNLYVNPREQWRSQSPSYSNNKCFGASLCIGSSVPITFLKTSCCLLKEEAKSQPSSSRDLFISKVSGVLGLQETSWALGVLDKMALVFIPPLLFLSYSVLFWSGGKGAQ